MTETHKKQLGKKGEAIAAKYLMQKGLVFVEHSFCAQGGEIDLIMKDKKNNEYVFVEVKTRMNDHYGSGLESISTKKLRNIFRGINAYFLKKLRLRDIPDFRIDAVEITVLDGKYYCNHVENIGFDDLPNSRL